MIINLTKEQNLLIKQATEKLDNNNQKLIAIEELSELQKEIIKQMRGKQNSENIAEEMADCIIMIAQIMDQYGNEDNVQKYLKEKFVRLAGILEKCGKK